jgi:hypothetical protein
MQERSVLDPKLHSRISRARVAAACPLETAAELRTLASAAHAGGLNSSTQSTYSSHVNYFLEFGLVLGCDIYRFGAPLHQGGLGVEEESRVRPCLTLHHCLFEPVLPLLGP